MITINYPEPVFRIRKEEGRESLFDVLRKKWVVLTPEEWVRQNFIQYLVQVKEYPSSLIAIEKEIRLGELKKRFDILIYDKEHNPWMMVECKSMDIQLDETVLQQVLRYNISTPVKHLVITNGKKCFAWYNMDGKLKEQQDLPDHDR